MALDIKVKISVSQASGSAGFGVPLILISKASAAVAYAEFSSLEEMEKGGYANTTAAYKLFQIMQLQDANARPAKIAVATVTGKAVDELPKYLGKVRQIIPILAETGDSTLAEIATYVETTDSMELFGVVSGVAELAPFKSLDRCYIGARKDPTDGLNASVVGATAGLDAGSFAYKNLILKGITPDDLTEAEISAIDEAGGYTAVTKCGDVVTSEGKAPSGEFLDIVDSFDWIIQNIEYRSQRLLNNTPKLAYDNSGIGQLESVTNGVLAEAFGKGIIATGDDGDALYATNFGKRSKTSATDRAARNYTLGKFSFELAGAIHTATITGTVTV